MVNTRRDDTSSSSTSQPTVEPEGDAQQLLGQAGGRGAEAAPGPRRTADRRRAGRSQRGTRPSRTSRARAYHGHAAVLVEEAVERHVRRAVRGHASGQTVEFIGPPRTVLAVQAIPLEDGGALVTDRRRQRAGATRCRAHRLRRQHQPRAEDARRCARRAGRDAGRHRRSDRNSPARRQDGRRGTSRRTHHRRSAGAVTNRARRCRRRPTWCRSSQVIDDAVVRAAGGCRTPLGQGHRRSGLHRPPRAGQPSATGVRRRQPARERRQVQRHRVRGDRRVASATTAGSRSS